MEKERGMRIPFGHILVVFEYDENTGKGSRPKIITEELITCEDCKHYVSDGGAIMYCEHTDVPTATSDYCSYGEREEE